MSKFFRQIVLRSQEISPCIILVQEVNAGPAPPESKINDLPYELHAKRSKIFLH